MAGQTMNPKMNHFSQELLGFLEKASGTLVIQLNQDNTIRWANRAVTRMAGFPAEACRGMEISDLLGQEISSLLEPGDSEAKKRPCTLSLGSSSYLADCHLISLEDGSKLLICEQIMLNENRLMEQMSRLNNEMTNMTRELHRKNRELQKALGEIKTLKDLLPICMHCKKIRDDDGYWNQLEAYISKHSNTQFSHSICEECLVKYYPDLDFSGD